MKNTLNEITRKNFLEIAWKGLLGLSGLLGLAGLWRYFSYQPYPAPVTRFDLGTAPNLPDNAMVKVPDAQAVLANNSESLQAYSLICPHLGCLVELNEEGFACPCHGSQFNPDGSVKRGPAEKPLRALTLEYSEDNHLILDTSDSNQ